MNNTIFVKKNKKTIGQMYHTPGPSRLVRLSAMKSCKIITVIVLTLLITGSCGGYFYAEKYRFEISKEELREKIEEFKTQNPQYKILYVNEKGERDGLDDCDSLFCYFYLYFSDIKATILCVMNVSKQAPPDSPTILKFTGITYSSNFGSWKSINTKDLTKEENKAIKKKFETEILDHLGKWRRPMWYE